MHDCRRIAAVAIGNPGADARRLVQMRLGCKVLTLALLVMLAGCSHPDPIEEAASAYKQAHTQLDRGYPIQALPFYDRAIALNPKFVDAYLERGRCRRLTDDLKGAAADFDRAIELNPELAEAHANRGSLRLKNRDFTGAIADFDAALAVNPKLAQAYGDRGLAHVSRGELKAAIEDIAAAIELDPDVAEFYSNRAAARRLDGDLDGALNDYSRAIELDNKFASAYNNRAQILQARQKFAEAAVDYDSAVAADPRLADAYSNRGFLRFSQNDAKTAIALQYEAKFAITDYDKAIALDPKLATAYSRRGLARLTTGEADKALADFDKAIALEAGLAEAHNGRGRALLMQSKLPEAIASFDNAIRTDPRLIEAYTNRALAKTDTRDFDGAIADYALALGIDAEPDEGKPWVFRWFPDLSLGFPIDEKRAEIYKDRGVTYQIWGEVLHATAEQQRGSDPDRAAALDKAAPERRKLALADFDRAIRLNDKLASAYDRRGLLRRATGDLDGAIDDFTQEIQLTPTLSSPYNNRALALSDLADQQLAKNETEPAHDKLTRAMNDYDQALRNDPKDAVVHANRGFLRLSLLEDQEAEQDFDDCFRLQPALKAQLEPQIRQIKNSRNQTSAGDKK